MPRTYCHTILVGKAFYAPADVLYTIVYFILRGVGKAFNAPADGPVTSLMTAALYFILYTLYGPVTSLMTAAGGGGCTRGLRLPWCCREQYSMIV